jgi:hypothetical protein
MAEHQMYTKEIGLTFINAKGKDCQWLLDVFAHKLTLFHVTGLYIPGIHFDCWENLYKEDRQRWLIDLGLLWSLCIPDVHERNRTYFYQC